MAQFADYLRLNAVQHSREHGLRRLPDNTEDHDCDDETDDRVGHRIAHPHSKCAKNNRQACEPVGSSVVAICN
jgi:hypothetical protein